jgi:transposase InsO family protein
MTKNLVSESLFKAVTVTWPAVGLIHHSDRGSQYCSREYRKILQQFKMQSSMSRRGDCYDNAPIESFWGTLKTELIFHRHYQTRGGRSEKSRSTLRSFTTVRESRRNSAIFHRPPTSAGFIMQKVA